MCHVISCDVLGGGRARTVILGNLDIGQWLLDADVNAKDDDHWTLLHGAANNRHVELFWTLLRTNTDINAQTKSEATPLYQVTNNRHLSIVWLLLDSSAGPDKAALHWWTLLHEVAVTDAHV